MPITRIGVDAGGTFTDFVVIRGGKIEVFKKLSTPARPEEAIMAGIQEVDAKGGPCEIIHGSTVATNALLERKGARTALVTTAGFEDVLTIGRQTRRELYNILVDRSPALIPDALRFGMQERVQSDGSVVQPLDVGALEELVTRLAREGVESVAVCLLFSFANPNHEQAIGRALERLKIPVSLSSEVLPEYREYERTSTTAINAYLAPVMGGYLGRLETRLGRQSLRVMQSNGGAVHARTVATQPVRTIVSGPAGGVVGAFHVAQASGYERIITFDMGGTSTDVALCDGAIRFTSENEVDGMPVGVPAIDIHTVGAGGGSIARIDPGGALRVGPESAGADPGPICYGKGEQLTVTDANVILGRLLARFFLGGAMELAAERVRPAVGRLRWARGWKSAEEMAEGVVDVVNGNMEQAVRLISVERGHDPRDFALFTFGGAGGLHAAELAKALGIPRVVVPRFPGALSALGLLLADARKDYSRSLLTDIEGSEKGVAKVLEQLHRAGIQELRSEGFKRPDIRIEDFLDLRYRGQSYELTIPLGRRDVEETFHEAHKRRYGYSNPGKPVEIVNARATLTGRVPKPDLPKVSRVRSKPRPVETCAAWIQGRSRKTAIYDRATLTFGHTIEGPAIVGEYSSTTLVPPDFRLDVDAHLNMVLQR